MTTTTTTDYCERCDAEVPAGALEFLQTHRATRYEPADGMGVCSDCYEAATEEVEPDWDDEPEPYDWEP